MFHVLRSVSILFPFQDPIIKILDPDSKNTANNPLPQIKGIQEILLLDDGKKISAVYDIKQTILYQLENHVH